MRKFILSFLAWLILAVPGFPQLRIGTGDVEKLYSQHCQVCHGQDLDGGLGGSLLDRSSWRVVGKEQSFLESVLNGNEAAGMPPFKDVLEPSQIRALEIYIDEERQIRNANPPVADSAGTYSAGGYKFRLETVVDGLDIPWSMAFLS